MNYKELENYEPKGELKGFPKEIIAKMLNYQEEQGNPRNVTVFEKNKHSTFTNGGFSWCLTKERYEFWVNVIRERNFALFFTKYPKQGKICSKCKIEKNLSEFHKHKEGVRSECKECRKKEYEASKKAKYIQEDTDTKPQTTINQLSSDTEINSKKDETQEFRVGDKVYDIMHKSIGVVIGVIKDNTSYSLEVYLENARKEVYTKDGRICYYFKTPQLLHYRDDYNYDVIDFSNLPKRQEPKKRWRAEIGKMYYYIWMFDNKLKLAVCVEQFMEFDNEKYNSGNYFKTKEEVSDKVKQLNEQLKQIINNNK